MPMTGFQAAILAIGGRSDCTYAKELAREAREKLGVLPVSLDPGEPKLCSV